MPMLMPMPMPMLIPRFRSRDFQMANFPVALFYEQKAISLFNPSVIISIYLCSLQTLFVEDKKIASFDLFGKMFFGLLEDKKKTE